MKDDITHEEFISGIKTIWDKRNESIMEIAAPTLSQQAEGSFRDALNGLDKLKSSGIFDCSVENIVKYLTPEQIEKVTPWLKEKGYGHLLKTPSTSKV